MGIAILPVAAGIGSAAPNATQVFEDQFGYTDSVLNHGWQLDTSEDSPCSNLQPSGGTLTLDAGSANHCSLYREVTLPSGSFPYVEMRARSKRNNTFGEGKITVEIHTDNKNVKNSGEYAQLTFAGGGSGRQFDEFLRVVSGGSTVDIERGAKVDSNDWQRLALWFDGDKTYGGTPNSTFFVIDEVPDFSNPFRVYLRNGSNVSEHDYYRISRFNLNDPPSAVCHMSFPDGVPSTGETISFDGSASSDPDGDDLSYEWDLTGDGSVDATGPTADHTYETGGEKAVTLTVTDEHGASDTCTLSFTVWIEATIDIKPGSSTNPINPNSKGNTPVAILQTDEFNPTNRVDVSSLKFGAAGDGEVELEDDANATLAHNGHIEDVDDDGDEDLMLHFPTEQTGFEDDDDQGLLVGETTDDPPIPLFGADSVKIVGGKGKGNGGGGGSEGGGPP